MKTSNLKFSESSVQRIKLENSKLKKQLEKLKNQSFSLQDDREQKFEEKLKKIRSSSRLKKSHQLSIQRKIARRYISKDSLSAKKNSKNSKKLREIPSGKARNRTEISVSSRKHLKNKQDQCLELKKKRILGKKSGIFENKLVNMVYLNE